MARWDQMLTGTLVICAVITTALVVRREVWGPQPASTPSQQSKPEFIDGWESELEKGVRLGAARAPVQLIEFADFECPYCGSFHKTLKELRERYPGQVALSFVHYPLPGHRFAEAASRVAECAGEQGRFEAMHDQLFEQQKNLGLKPWSEFAKEAGVPDLKTFQSCADSAEPMSRVMRGRQLADQFEVRGTPTLVVNGWKLGRPPSAEDLDRMVKAILAGERPISADRES